MCKIGEEGTVCTYTNQNMAEKLVLLKKSQGYIEVKQNPKCFLFLQMRSESISFLKKELLL